MKILHIASIGHRATGIGSVLINLEKSQKVLCQDVKILSLNQNVIYDDIIIDTVKNIKDFRETITEFKPNICIFHGLYYKEFISFYKYLIKNNIPYLIVLHGALSKENYKHNLLKKRIARFLFIDKFIKQACSIIYLNKAEYKNSIVPLINSNYTIIPNGCNIITNPTMHPIIKNKIELVFIGRIDIHTKGLDILLNAIELLTGYSKRIHFSFYGVGVEKNVTDFKENLNKFNNIADFKGGVYGKEKDTVLRNSDIFILTSRSEGMPMGILEALSYGVPCLITPQTNMVDIIEIYKCGWVTDLSSMSIAETVIKAANDICDKKEEMFNNSLQAAKKYSWKEIAKKSIEEYSKYTT
ncbi:MAG: glycosyltransferase [Bacteroidales bacterium]|nr:glycosyltransferase [Bacteroidales bacterium]